MGSKLPLVLVVEDEPGVAEVLHDFLEIEGYRVELAGNCADGKILLSASGPALLITDAMLPDGSGYRLAGEAKRSHVPVLVISGELEPGVPLSESVQFLGKPFTLNAFREKVAELIASV